MQNIEVYTPFDCLIVNGERQQFLSQNEHLIIEEAQQIFVYPVSKAPCYSFVLDTSQPSPFYKSISRGDKTLIFLLDGLLSNSYELYTFTSHGKTCQVKAGSEKVVFACDKIEREVILPFPIQKYDAKCEEHIVYVFCEGTNHSFLVAFNLLNKHAKIFSGYTISLKDHGFMVENEDSLTEYLIDKDGISRKTIKTASNCGISSVNFFACLKEGDYISAYNMISSSLQENLSQNDFKKFFGQISYFFPLSQTKIFALSNTQPKLYTLTIADNKITDIDDE